MNNLRSILSWPKRFLNLPNKLAKKIQYSRSLPRNHVVEDVFIVSYPKSGNTWVRFLIANAIKVHYQIEREVNFFSITDIIPSVMGNTNLRQEGPFGRTDIPRIIKSHSAYNPYYYRVILLVRDPRDVMASYLHYLTSRKQISDDIKMSEFIRHPKYGVENWIIHTKSWYYNDYGRGGGQIIRIFRYEDFLKDTKSQLFSLMECLGIRMDERALEETIALSSKDKMTDSEKKHRSTNITNEKIPFVRQGIASGGKELSDTDRKFVENSTRGLAQILGYEF